MENNATNIETNKETMSVDISKFPKRATIKEAAEILGFSTYAVTQMCNQGILPFIAIGRRKYVLIELAQAALEAEALATQQRQKELMENRRPSAVIHIGKHYDKISSLI